MQGTDLEVVDSVNFQHGFTTRKFDHGFGPHSGGMATVEIRGSVTVHSEGQGNGEIIALDLPYHQGGRT